MINTKELNLVLAEAAALTNKGKWGKQDEKRFAYLQTAAAAIKAGASLQEVGLETARYAAGPISATLYQAGRNKDKIRGKKSLLKKKYSCV